MAMQQYTFRRGAPVMLGDRIEDALGADPADFTMRARMRALSLAQRDAMPSADGCTAVHFSTTYVPATESTKGSWLHSLSAEQSAALSAGQYLFDSTLLRGGAAVWTSDPVRIVITESASAPAGGA